MRPITAADLMNPDVLTVPDDMSVRDLARFLVDNDITGAPVEDDAGRLVGVVSVFDIARLLGEDEDDFELEEGEGERANGASDDDGLDEAGGDEDELLVEDIMTPAVWSVTEEATVPEVASLMLKEHLHRLLVVREEEPVGIISTSDLLGLLMDEA
ncbi:MAG TPA: CBS domain-containing protein [Thermoanaerobaculia bacterium]|nr:CBS domain-containing protein [Thermoanaerobaculia bacterium]